MIKFLLVLAAAFILIPFCQKSFVQIRLSRIERKIKKNPLIGIKQGDGSYSYKEKGCALNYTIKEGLGGVKRVEWISLKRRLPFFERRLRHIERSINKIFLYRRWTVFFRPSIFFIFIASALIFYFGIIEPQDRKVERVKWLIARSLGVDSSSIQYIGNGWLEISGQRKMSSGINEPVKYAINPFRWLFSQDAGFISRWKGKDYGYVTHPVVFNENGEVWMNKEGVWRHGMLTQGRTIEWDSPQGARRVSQQELSTQEKKVYILDK